MLLQIVLSKDFPERQVRICLFKFPLAFLLDLFVQFLVIVYSFVAHVMMVCTEVAPTSILFGFISIG